MIYGAINKSLRLNSKAIFIAICAVALLLVSDHLPKRIYCRGQINLLSITLLHMPRISVSEEHALKHTFSPCLPEDNAIVSYQIGLNNLYNNQFDIALKNFRQAREYGLKQPFVWLFEGQAQQQLGNENAAIDAWKSGKTVAFFITQAESQRLKANLVAAEGLLRQAVVINPQSSKASFALGRVLLEIGQLKEASQYAERAIELDPSSLTNYILAGNTHRLLGNYSQATMWYEKIFSLDGGKYEEYAWKYFGLTALEQQETTKAIEAFTSALTTMRDHDHQAELHYYLGQAYLLNGNNIVASEELEKAVQLEPNAILFQLYLADFYLDQGRLEDARNQYNAVLQLDANNQRSLTGLQRIHSHNN